VNGERVIQVDRAGSVATVHIDGVLMHAGPWWAKLDGDATDYMDIRAALDEVAQDSGVSEVILAINSPGGDAVGLAETVAAIDRVRAAGKPIRAHIGGMGTSAAYFLASATDEITAEPDALVGSIGTMTVLRDTTGLQSNVGIRLELIASGPEKAMGADGKITPEYRAQTQRRIDAFAAVFREQVGKGRKMTADQVAAVSTGDYWLASDAKFRGLIDAIGSAPSPRAVRATAQAASTPLAAASNAQESPMDPKILAALAVMSANHPTQAEALAVEAAKPGATVASLEAFIAPIAAKAKEDAHAAEVADLKAKLTAAEKSRDEAKAETEKAKAQAAHQTGAPDVGADASAIQTITGAKFVAMTPEQRADHIAKNGAASVVG
jgi:signal peptide peptidase SppA